MDGSKGGSQVMLLYSNKVCRVDGQGFNSRPLTTISNWHIVFSFFLFSCKSISMTRCRSLNNHQVLISTQAISLEHYQVQPNQQQWFVTALEGTVEPCVPADGATSWRNSYNWVLHYPQCNQERLYFTPSLCGTQSTHPLCLHLTFLHIITT